MERLKHVNNWHGENFKEGVPSHVMEGPGVQHCDWCDRYVIRGAGRWWENEKLMHAWRIVTVVNGSE